MLTIESIRSAHKRIRGKVRHTPLLNAPRLDAMLGFNAYFKAECLQVTGSFKFRGAYNRIAQLSAPEKEKGVITYSSGNHAQGVAHAAALFGVPATIIMPEDAPEIKKRNTKEYGAHIILYNRYEENREEIAKRENGGRENGGRGAVLIPPFDDDDVMSGQGTIALEILDEYKPDALISPAGGGGLIAGVSTVMAAHNCEVFAAEPEGFDDLARSLISGKRERNHPDTRSICDAIITPSPGKLTFPILQKTLAGAFSVSDDEVRQAMKLLAEELKLVVEPGGAAGFAAAIKNRAQFQGKSVAIILSGGNVDQKDFAKIIG